VTVTKGIDPQRGITIFFKETNSIHFIINHGSHTVH